MASLSLQSTWIGLSAAVIIAAAFVYLLTRRPRPPVSIWAIAVGVAGVLAAGTLITVRLLAEDASPRTMTFAWPAAGLVLAIVGIAHLLHKRAERNLVRRRRIFKPVQVGVSAAMVVVAVVAGTNYTGRFVARLGDLWGANRPVITTFIPASTPTASAGATAAPILFPLAAHFTPSVPVPSKGTVHKVTIAATASAVKPRDAYVYLPPAYQDPKAPPLPVLLALHGVPGGPIDFTTGATQAMDDFAAKNNGLAPVVIFPDTTGGQNAESLCADGSAGKWATYLVQDVPTWALANLKVLKPGKHWAATGLSAGGTCSLQLAARTPEVISAFVNLSGELNISQGTRKQTIKKAFAGDEAAFAANNPLDIFKTHTYTGVAGKFVIGAQDSGARDLQKVSEAAAAAGMDVEFDKSIPGGHDWVFWPTALAKYTPWLASQLGITQ